MARKNKNVKGYTSMDVTKKGKYANRVTQYEKFNDFEYGDSILTNNKYRFPSGKGMSTYGADSDLYKDGRHVLSFDNGWDSYWGKAKIKDRKSMRKIKEQRDRIKKYLDENRHNMDLDKQRRFDEALYSANMALQYKNMKNKESYWERKSLARMTGSSVG